MEQKDMMNPHDAEALIKKYLSGECNEQEKTFVEVWYSEFKHEGLPELTVIQWKQVAKSSAPGVHQTAVFKTLWNWRNAAASLLILVLTGGIYYLTTHSPAPSSLTISGEDVKAGYDQATLVRSDGHSIVLNAASQHTQLLTSENIDVRQHNGEIIYTEKANHKAGKLLTNTVSTPKGGQWHVILPDRTQVWLNAASSLTFPDQFNGHEREVKLTGEAYFEVSKDTEHPFIVRSDNQTLRVLGTHFNIRSYKEDSAVHSTLLEGSVQLITHSNIRKILKPGQEAINLRDKHQVTIRKVDADVAIAWKNGLFIFEHEALGDIMKKISRWYNVDVIYMDPSLSQRVFSGSVSKRNKMSEVLKMLAVTGNIYFKIQDRKILISSEQL